MLLMATPKVPMQAVRSETLDNPTEREVVRLRVLAGAQKSNPKCNVEVVWVGFYELRISTVMAGSIEIIQIKSLRRAS